MSGHGTYRRLQFDGKLLATRLLCAALRAQLPDAPPCSEPAAQSLQEAALTSSEARILRLPSGLSGASLVRFLLRERYDIKQDDAWLRAAAIASGAAGIGRHFDALRRDYRQRRELAGSRVSGGQLCAEDAALVRALGCEYRSEPE
ncbi:MAG: DUF3410 domain-containing protein [Halioglobus sp.]